MVSADGTVVDDNIYGGLVHNDTPHKCYIPHAHRATAFH